MVDYSKWRKIEISDDEDDTHPNIDTASLFRWRHDARLQRMAEQQKTKQELVTKQEQLADKLKQLDLSHTNQRRAAILQEKTELENKIRELEKRERLQPWNVDTISKDSWSTTLINRKCLQSSNVNVAQSLEESQHCQDDDRFSKDKIDSYEAFVEKYEQQIKEFAFHSHFEDCRRYLLENPNIVHEHTLDYLSLWCMQLHIDGKTSLLEHVCRQAVMLQMILDLAKTFDNMDPRSCLSPFFAKSKQNFDKFQSVFNEELADFKIRVEKAADLRIQNAIKEQEDNPKEMVGPGGLNAQEVFESLPSELQKCFENRDQDMLAQTLSKMDKDEAEYHLKRCVDAGLWLLHKEEDEDEKLYKQVMQQRKQLTEDEDESSQTTD